MARTYEQDVDPVWNLTSGCFTAAGASSASLGCLGNSRLIGFFRTDQALETGSGLLLRQSVDGGQNWDYVSASDTVGAGGSVACSVEILGNAVRVDIKNGSTEASAMRFGFWIRPI